MSISISIGIVVSLIRKRTRSVPSSWRKGAYSISPLISLLNPVIYSVIMKHGRWIPKGKEGVDLPLPFSLFIQSIF